MNKMDVAHELAAESTDNADIDELRALWYDNCLGDYSGWEPSDLEQEYKDIFNKEIKVDKLL